MADSDTGQERTEQPTARRREQARSDGRIARSPELVSASATLAGTAILATGGVGAIGAFAHHQLLVASTPLGPVERNGDGALVGTLRPAILGSWLVLVPLLGVIAATAIAAGLAPTRGAVSWKPGL